MGARDFAINEAEEERKEGGGGRVSKGEKERQTGEKEGGRGTEWTRRERGRGSTATEHVPFALTPSNKEDQGHTHPEILRGWGWGWGSVSTQNVKDKKIK